ncbi:polysaccharide deacetylase family protein [Actinacidiphila sp. bgisy167]|uniref:polysaccharide deacetylase family protein n=1 Tax=Actinacidiphila sp. bgisy167 TaxID=3413797 RepID=UPI003D74805F
MALTIRSNRAFGAVAAVVLAGAALGACGTEHMVDNAGTAASAPSVRPTGSAAPSRPPVHTAPPSAPAAPPAPRTGASSGTPGDAGRPAGAARHGAGGTTHESRRLDGSASHGTGHDGPAAPGATDRRQAPGQGAGEPTGAGAQAPPRGTAVTGLTIQHGVEAPGKSVALTFDDGPNPVWTPKILALLAQHHAKATFCEIGPNAQAHPDLVRRIVAAGHRLCDHSVHHDEAQSRKSQVYNQHEILDARDEITSAAGSGSAPLWYYRAPGGDFSPAIRAIAAGNGLRPLGWTVDSEDWRRPGTNAILATVNRELKPGSIVLMHDGGGDRSQTVRALAVLLDRLDAAGYTYTFPQR